MESKFKNPDTQTENEENNPSPYDRWSYLTESQLASDDFMDGVEDLPIQEREA